MRGLGSTAASGATSLPSLIVTLTGAASSCAPPSEAASSAMTGPRVSHRRDLRQVLFMAVPIQQKMEDRMGLFYATGRPNAPCDLQGRRGAPPALTPRALFTFSARR